MRRVVFIPLLVACMLATVHSQSPYSQLTLLVDLQTYLSPVYAAERRSPSAFLFFSGERVYRPDRIFNQSGKKATLITRSTDLEQLFMIQTTRDGLPFPLQLQFADRISKFFSGGEYPYSLDQSLQSTKVRARMARDRDEWHFAPWVVTR